MSTSMLTGVNNEDGATLWRIRIGGTRWWLVFCFLAAALPVRADTFGDYTYTVTPNGKVRIDGYSGAGGAVVIPSTIDGKDVIGIGASAFASHAGLTGVTIPNSVTYLEDRVFNACTGLASIAIGSGVASIGYGSFDSCPRLTAITVDAGNATYSSLDGVLFNKGQTTLIDCPEGRSGSYTIPASVTRIEDYAFLYCTSLSGITIDNNVATIGKEAFWGCTNLPGVTIPDSVGSIGEDAFNQCAGLASVTLGRGVTNIGNSAFYECTRLAAVTIPDSVASIGEMAFSRCTSLAAITVGGGNAAYSSLDGVLFNKDQTILVQCPGGKAGSYTVPNTVTNIGGDPFAPYPAEGLGGFSWCVQLTSITIPSSITTIGKRAFLYCSNLTSITLPASIASIGYYAFENCTGLADFTLPAHVTRIAHMTFAGCAGLLDVTIPDSVTNIDAQAFTGCSGLTDVTIPNSVVGIGMSAFSGCSNLLSVTLGRGVTSIGDHAFAGCLALVGAYFRGDAPSAGLDVFLNNSQATVYYLAGAMGWGETFAGRPTALWNALPEPAIRANGAAGEITLAYPTPVSLTVALDAGSYAGTAVDWWVVAYAYSGAWYYLDSSMQWTLFSGNLAACRPVYQGGLFNLAATPVLSNYVLSSGTYDFWFAIDYPMDGILDPNGQILFNKVTIVVQ